MQNLNMKMMILYVLIYVKTFFLLNLILYLLEVIGYYLNIFLRNFLEMEMMLDIYFFFIDEIGCFVRLVKCARFVIL